MPKVETELDKRKKKIDAISHKIAVYAVSETYSDETVAQGHLAKAIEILDAAKAALKDPE